MTEYTYQAYKDSHWNRCEVCGRFIAFADFDRGAVRRMVTPDTAFTAETYETLCREHAPKIKCSGHEKSAGQGRAEG